MQRSLVDKIGESLNGMGLTGSDSSGDAEVWDPDDVVVEKAGRIADAIVAAKGAVVIFTGAGISTASG